MVRILYYIIIWIIYRYCMTYMAYYFTTYVLIGLNIEQITCIFDTWLRCTLLKKLYCLKHILVLQYHQVYVGEILGRQLEIWFTRALYDGTRFRQFVVTVTEDPIPQKTV